jgi:hypothetical protein
VQTSASDLVAQLQKTFGDVFEIMDMAPVKSTNNILKDGSGTGCHTHKIDQ